MTLDGYRDYRTTLSAGLASNGETLGPFELAEMPAHIEITSRPLGADVVELATGDVWGVTPLTREVPRSANPIEVELRLPRYQSERREIVPEREQIAIEIELRRARRSTPREEPAEPQPDSGSSSPFGGTVD